MCDQDEVGWKLRTIGSLKLGWRWLKSSGLEDFQDEYMDSGSFFD